MTRLQTLISGVFLLQSGISQSAPRDKRWIPERLSDNDYGMETQSFPTGISSDGYSSNALSHPNFLSYWSDFYPGGDYSGMYYRANQDPNHGAMDPVQQLQNVQHYSYVQSLYPNGFPYPTVESAPSGPYQTDPSGRAVIAFNPMNSLNQGQTHQSANQVLVMDRQQPMGFIMGNNQFGAPSMFPIAGHPQMFFVAPQTTQFQLPQSAETIFVNPSSPQQMSTVDLINGIESLQSLEQNNEATKALLGAAFLNKVNQQHQTSVEAIQQDVEEAKELLDTLSLANELAQPTEEKNKKIIVIVEESVVDHAQTQQHSHKESQKQSGQQHSLQNRLEESVQPISETEAEDEVVDEAEEEVVEDPVEETGDEAEDEGAQQHSEKVHKKKGVQHHSTKDHEKESTQHHSVKQDHNEGFQHHSKKDHEGESSQHHSKKDHEGESSQHHSKKDHEGESSQHHKTPATEETDTEESSTKHIKKTSETTKHVQKAHGRAHDSQQDIYSAPNFENGLYKSNPVDLIYPGVMVPVQNRPTVPSYYYPSSQYGSGEQRYSPQTVSTTSGNPYGSAQAYQPLPTAQYANIANPYISSQLGPYANPAYQGYQVPVTSSPLSPYSSYYYPPRVTRNSAAVPMPVVQYVYGGSIFPQFG